FQSIIPKNWLRMFSPPELQRVISGDDDDWDITDLRRCTEYKEGYFDQHPCIRNFWSILEDFKSNDKKALLKFVTSCSKPPLGGFKFLTPKFTICKVSIVLESDSPLSTTTPNSNNLSSNLRQVKSLFSSISSNLKTSVTNTSKARLPTSSTW
ncbi:3200_t:CDS:2, partial [Entrophospora sp. SA101]